jgi:hypothetical protein
MAASESSDFAKAMMMWQPMAAQIKNPPKRAF